MRQEKENWVTLFRWVKSDRSLWSMYKLPSSSEHFDLSSMSNSSWSWSQHLIRLSQLNRKTVTQFSCSCRMISTLPYLSTGVILSTMTYCMCFRHSHILDQNYCHLIVHVVYVIATFTLKNVQNLILKSKRVFNKK